MLDTALVSALSPYNRALLDWRARWIDTARPKQLAPPGDWDVWLAICGRGFGKTRLGAEYIGFEAASRPKTRWFAGAPTRRDCKNIQFEGKSGLVNVIPERLALGGSWRKAYNRSELTVTLANGAQIFGHSAEKPDSWRGPEYHGGWPDEIASWGAVTAGGKQSEGARLQEAWDNIIFGLRLGSKPRLLVTGTPRPIPFLRKLIKEPNVKTVFGSTFENERNLAPSAIAAFKRVYEGTRKGQQELFGVILDDAEGALWSHALIEAERIDGELIRRAGAWAVRWEDDAGVDRVVDLVRVVVAVDPATTAGQDSDETGVVVVGLGDDGRYYVLADHSGKYSPNEWAREVLTAHSRYGADAIVAETNQGGDLVEANIRNLAPSDAVRIVKVHAKRGKYLRAEPAAALYEQGKVSHLGYFPKLESQMVQFDGSAGGASPDRLDGLVYGLGELAFGAAKHDFW